MNDFEYWMKKSQKQDLVDFTFDREGLMWLKLKSVVRPGTLDGFIEYSGRKVKSTKVAEKFKELYIQMQEDVEKAIQELDDFSAKEHAKIVTALDFNQLVHDLYKVKSFEWGGDYANSLDKYLVLHYVKNIPSYDELQAKFDGEISNVVRRYVMNSWYNHWTSILIENEFKKHAIVTPTVGQIKSVDFFVNNYPFDLKVTYLPSGYINEVIKALKYKNELTYLKQQAKTLEIEFDKEASNEDIYYEIVEKLKEKKTEGAKAVLDTISQQRKEILKYTKEHKSELAKWLYENQGEMRFGSENRLFLILIDNNNWDDSWKLKRNIDLLSPNIQSYLDSFARRNIEDMKVTFSFKGSDYTAYADVLFIIDNE